MPDWHARARELGLWPAAASFETVYVVGVAGDAYYAAHVDLHDLTPVEDPRERNWLLHAASQRHAELRHLAPVRRSGDFDCPDCGGTGRPRWLEGERHANILCTCGGVGWLPAGYVDPHRPPGV